MAAPVRFDKKWFNPLYFILNDIIKIPTIRTVLIYGGKSSSKTFTIAQLLSKEAIIKGSSSIAFRKESTSIPTTLKKTFNAAQDKIYISPAFERQDRIYKCEPTGAEIVLKGMDDSEKAKGVESYKYLLFDELNQFEQAEFEQADLSLRGIPNQKIFGTWNPVDENSWVKTELVDKYEWIETEWKLPHETSFVKISTCGSIILIRTVYQDNYWTNGRPGGEHGRNNEFGYRDESLISRYERLRTTNNNSYKVNVLGEWGKTVFGGEFLKCWRSEIHTGDFPYNPKLAVHLIFDENVNPYFPCAIIQIADNQKEFFLIHAIAMKNPNNNTKSMAREITRKLREWHHSEAVFIGGDPTSQKADVKQEKGHDLFRLMMNELEEWKPRRNTLVGSPSVRVSADFLNSILENETEGIVMRVDSSCRVAIIDFENTKEDKNGKVDKKTVIDPITKVSYQPYGHFVDIVRYFVCKSFQHEYARYQKPGTLNIFTGKDISKHAY